MKIYGNLYLPNGGLVFWQRSSDMTTGDKRHPIISVYEEQGPQQPGLYVSYGPGNKGEEPLQLLLWQKNVLHFNVYSVK